MTLKTKFTTAIATGAILLNALAPLALADTSLEVSGNGSSSDNTVNVSSNNNTTVSQNNAANVSNTVTTNADTGHNTANDNTGGDTFVSSGNAGSQVDIQNTLNSNHAMVNGGNSNGNTQVQVAGNGSRSDNTVNLNNGGSTNLTQNNYANVSNDVKTNANTGYNSANRNTGGDTTVWSGDAWSSVALNTTANANIAQVNGNGGGNGNTDVWLKGNGAFSNNTVNLNNGGSSRIDQNNSAFVTNNVDTNLTTGHNRANDNTGGDTGIFSGNAFSQVGIDNMLNFNAANLEDGGWTGDLTAKISGNGSFSDNNINANFGGNQAVFQNNYSDVYNNVHQNMKTGYNSANRNTGPVYGYDPVTIWGGDAGSNVSIMSTANRNELGLGSFSFPWLGQVSFNFDMTHIWGGWN